MDAQRIGRTRVGAGLSIIGEIHAQEDLEIAGRIDGQLTIPEHHLDVRPGAIVKARVVATTVAIAGTVDGTVAATDSIVIEPSANVRGHLMTPSITLRDGAHFNGTVDPARTEAAVHVAKYRQKQSETPVAQ